MKKLQNGKELYDNIKIPKELNALVICAIEKSSETSKKNRKEINHFKVIAKWVLATAAVLFAFMFVGINTSTAFAKELKELPILGAVVRVLTIRSYQYDVDDTSITVQVPALEDIQNATNGLSYKVNEEISRMCNVYVEDAKQRAKEYKEAFIETGGTEKEWREHDIQIKVWYEIQNQSEQYLSFTVKGTESWISAYAETKYYNLDLKNIKYVSLSDLLGEDYINLVNRSINSQISKRKVQGEEFWSIEEGGFETIDSNIKFYINQKGNPMIVFDKYEIAPGSMGQVEFEIERWD